MPDVFSPDGRLRVRTHATRGVVCHAFEGDLDGAMMGLMIDRVRGAAVVELNLRAVSFVDSIGLLVLGNLADAYDRDGTITRLMVSGPAVLHACDVVGLLDRYDVHVASLAST